MTKRISSHYSLVVFCLVLLASFGVSAGEVSATDPGMDIATQIESANTKSDHEAIAAYFEAEAKRIDAEIAGHKRMSAAYHGARQLRRLGVRMRKHCDMLIKNYEAAAVETREMAKIHRDMATQLP